MDVSKTVVRAGALLVCLAWSFPAPAQVFKCVDPATGKTTFSDRGCSAGDDGAAVNIRPANSIDGSQYRQQAIEPKQYRTAVGFVQGEPRVTVVGEGNDAERERTKRCKQASTLHSGSRGLTASQLSATAQLCAGASVAFPAEGQSTSLSVPHPPASPLVITNCDPAGCWDSNGVRYNKGAGDTYFRSSGGPACQRMGGNLSCP
ncbi:DUF4124 domain-containing protein [Pseudomonas sp. PDM21]|uniref:DUF4124 domain-containing protein n=1 Tax=Pseudomonas sp. PDM21 TaxID=2769257 RepID=UPI00177AFD7F|nr:DUF4124 domain-containing protein [Pseudomonas sp. PDM21]